MSALTKFIIIKTIIQDITINPIQNSQRSKSSTGNNNILLSNGIVDNTGKETKNRIITPNTTGI